MYNKYIYLNIFQIYPIPEATTTKSESENSRKVFTDKMTISMVKMTVTTALHGIMYFACGDI